MLHASIKTPDEKPLESLVSSGQRKLEIDLAALDQMSITELRNLKHALRTIHDVLCAFNCQPRFDGKDRNTLNGAGEVLWEMLDFVANYESTTVNFARAATGLSPDDANERNWMVLEHDAEYGEGIAPSFRTLA